MRWILIICFLLATATDILSGHRSKRDLSHIKNFIASKLFGTETIMIQLPEIPKNKTFQLFKIKGYDNILLKVIRKANKHEDTEQEQVVTEKVNDPVIASPEIAIIGNYLGTTTQGETLLAIEIAKNLLKSGILRGELEKYIQEAIPLTSQDFYKDYIASKPVKPVNIFAEEKNPVYFFPALNGKAEKVRIVNSNPVPLSSVKYSPLLVASELHYRPLQTKYSYKQKGDTADMVYESYNNQDVIVTRTDKEPPLPQYIKLRIADVASLGANPFLMRSQQPVAVIPEENVVQPINLVSRSYDYLNPSMEIRSTLQPAPIPTYMMNSFNTTTKPADSLRAVEEMGHVASSNKNSTFLSDSLPLEPSVFSELVNSSNFLNSTKLHFDIRDHLSNEEVVKINRFINEKLNIGPDSQNVITLNITSSSNNEENVNKNQKVVVKEGQKNLPVTKAKKKNSRIITKYLYNKFNHRSHDNYSVVNHGKPRRPNQSYPFKTNTVKSSDELPKDFVYVPPKNVFIPLTSMIPKTNDMQDQKNNDTVKINSSSENYTNSLFTTKPVNVKEATENTEQVKVSSPYSLKENPIVVLDDKSDKEQIDSETYKRPHTSFRPYVGGPVF